MRLTAYIAACIGFTIATASSAQISGRPVPELQALDTMVTELMDDNDITAGVLGLMKDGRIVYLRGFGVDYNGLDLPENAPFRIASCTKPFTAAAVQKLIADGDISQDDQAFDVPGFAGGLLPVTPFPFLTDARIADITVDHLLRHRGGWDRDQAGIDDLTYKELVIADDMGIGSPPGRDNTMRWILGQSLQFDPGDDFAYANIGYLALALIVESETGQDHIDYLRQNILTPGMWVPTTEFYMGRTFREWQNPREPFYDDPEIVNSVFDSYGFQFVLKPYGGWDHEARTGQGRIVASPASMLEFAERYRVGISADIGKRRSDAPLTNHESHGGSLGGLNSVIYQRTDGINVFAAFSQSGNPNHAGVIRDAVAAYLDSNTVNVPRTSDGFWTNPGGGSGGVGGFHRPFGSFATAMSFCTDGSKIRMRPGTSAWTGTISKRMLIDAPLGVATIGQQ